MAFGGRVAVGRSSSQFSDPAQAGRGGGSETLPSIVVLYSHEDKALAKRLVTHLRVLETHGLARVFWDIDIQEGRRWRDEIEKEIDGASIALLLLSADSLNSSFVNNHEVPRILEREAEGLLFFPVLLRPCAWQICEWLEERQIYMQDGKALDLGTPEEVEQHFADLTLEVFQLLSEAPDFDPPAAALPAAEVDTAIEAKGESAEEAKILQAGDRFRRKALAELQVRLALQTLVATRRKELNPWRRLIPWMLVSVEPFPDRSGPRVGALRHQEADEAPSRGFATGDREQIPGRVLVVIDDSASMPVSNRDPVTYQTLPVREDHVRHLHIQAGPPAFTWTAGVHAAIGPLCWDRYAGAIFSQGGEGPWTVYAVDAEPGSGRGDWTPYYWARFFLQGEWRWETVSINESYYACVYDLFDRESYDGTRGFFYTSGTAPVCSGQDDDDGRWGKLDNRGGFSFQGEWRWADAPMNKINCDGVGDSCELDLYPPDCWSPVWNNSFTGDTIGDGS